MNKGKKEIEKSNSICEEIIRKGKVKNWKKVKFEMLKLKEEIIKMK